MSVSQIYQEAPGNFQDKIRYTDSVLSKFPDIAQTKGSGYKQYMREKSFWEPRLAGYSDPEQGRKNFNRALFKHALDHEGRANSYKTSTTYPAWNLVSDFNGMGPRNVNGTSYTSSIGTGLVNDIEVNPTDTNSWTIAIAGGGVWQTSDKGISWYDLDPNHYLPIQDTWDVEINPSNPDEIYVALTGFAASIIEISTYSLGVYKTTDNGQFWFYCDTIGILSSELLRESWAVRRVKVDRLNNDKVYAYGSLKVSGVVKDQFWYSESKGDTFNRVDLFPNIHSAYQNRMIKSSEEIYEDIHIAQTGSHNFIYLSGQNLLRSSDEGQTWTDITPNLAYLNDNTKSCFGYYPMEMRLASNDSILYAVYNVQNIPVSSVSSGDTSYTFNGLRGNIYLEYSTDWGDSWNEINQIPGYNLNSHSSGILAGGELGMAIVPGDNSATYTFNRLVIGYVDYALSNNGGQTFSRITDGYSTTFPNSKWIHPDNRGLRLIEGSNPSEFKIISANDGGIAFSSDSGYNWEVRVNGLHSEPLGGIALWEENSDTLMAGAIHIGGILKLGKKCYTTSQGDRGDAVLGKLASSISFAGVQLPFNVFENSLGTTFRNDSIHNMPPSGCYPTLPIVVHPSNPSVLHMGKVRNSATNSFIMQSTDYGVGWLNTTNGESDGVKNFCSISHCLKYPSVMYAIAAENILYGGAKPFSKIVYKSTNGGMGWVDITGTPATNTVLNTQIQWRNNATGIVSDPDDPNTVFIYYSSFGDQEDAARVLMSTNGGVSFNDISVGLPAFPVMDLVCVPGEENEMFLANDINVYYTNKDSGYVWHLFDNGLPAGMMRDLEYHLKDRKLFVATTGKGIWETELPCDAIPTRMDTIVGNVLWDIDRSPLGNIIIPANCTLTIQNCQIRMRDDRFIAVERGGLLIVDNATLTSCSNSSRWRGIMVWGDPTVQNQAYAPFGSFGKLIVKNNSLIENAHEGIGLCKGDYVTYSIDYTTCGGILEAYNTTFKNCRRAIAFMKHPAGTYNAKIENCTFLNTKENTALNQFFVTLWGVNRVTFFNCRFINEEANDDYKMGGVYSIDANYNFYNHLSYLPNKTYFKNLSYGVMVQNFVNTNPVNVDDGVFENCARGVYLGNTVNSNILLNDFKIRNYSETIPYGNCIEVNNYFGDNYGVFSDGSHFFRIEENKFTTHDTFSVYDPNIGFDRQSGCIVSNNWGASDMVYKNNFSNLLVANKAFGINRDAQLSATAPATYTLGTQGLQFRCNNYDQGDIPFSTTGVLGVVAEWQGVFKPLINIIIPAGNLFNSHSSISSPGTHIWYTPDWNQLVPYAMITPQQSVNIKYVFDMNNNCIPNINLDNAINVVDVNFPTGIPNDPGFTCPSNLTTGGGGGSSFSLASITEFKDSIQVSNALLLAGNAAALHAALDTMSPEDAKIEFDAVGPFISDSVLLHLIDVAYINPAPEWWQILKSNAPLRDDLFELCHELDMDEFDWWELQMIQKKNWSQREMLIAKIGWYRDSIQYQIRDALSYFYPLIPIEEVYLDTLDSYLSIYQTEQTILDRIDIHLASRNPDFAIQLLDTLADFNALYLPYATLLGEVISVYDEPGGVYDLPEDLLDSIQAYVSGRKLRYERFNTILVANGLFAHCEDIPALGMPGRGAERESHVLPDESLKRKYEEGLNVFPNPAISEVRIYFKNRKSQAADLKVFDLTGKEVYAIRNFQTNREFIIPDGILAPGGYIVKAISEIGIQRTSKLIKL